MSQPPPLWLRVQRAVLDDHRRVLWSPCDLPLPLTLRELEQVLGAWTLSAAGMAQVLQHLEVGFPVLVWDAEGAQHLLVSPMDADGQPAPLEVVVCEGSPADHRGAVAGQGEQLVE